MDKSGENEARGLTAVDDQEIASTNSGAMAGATKVGTKVAPQNKLEKERLKASDVEADYYEMVFTSTGERVRIPRGMFNLF